MGKRMFLCFLALLFGVRVSYGYESFTMPVSNSVEIPVEAGAVIVMEAKSGRVLFGKNIEEKRAMASTTKILTALIALEQPDLHQEFSVNQEDIMVEGSSMGLRADDRVSLDLLAQGMILPSGNDAANVAAVHIAGSKEKFAELMNHKAEEMGMLDSHFVTPSGLDAEGHYSTAYDMATLTRYAMRNNRFREICSKSYAHVMLGNPPTERTLKNYNKLLEQYEYCIGVKTGFTDAAGRCLVSAANKDGMELIVVTMDCGNDFNIHKELYQYFFGKMILVDISQQVQGQSIPVAGYDRSLQAVPQTLPLVPLIHGEEEKLEVVVKMKPMLYAPVELNAYAGSVEAYIGNELVYETELVTGDEFVPQEKSYSWYEKLMGWLGNMGK